MIVGIYFPEKIDPVLETHAYLLANKDVKVFIIFPFRSYPKTLGHPWAIKRLVKYNSNIEIVSYCSKPQKLDWLYIYTSDERFLWNGFLNGWASIAKNIGLISLHCATETSNWKRKAKEICFSLPYCLFAKVAEISTASCSKRALFFIKRKFFCTPYVHPQLLTNEIWKDKVFSSISVDSFRQYKFSFMGARSPAHRVVIINKVFEKLRAMNNIKVVEELVPEDSPMYGGKDLALLRTYDTENRCSLGPLKYIDILGMSDFSICFLGWGRGWTHRSVESLARGAIPILEYPEYYNLGLRDMQNCIVVKNHKWEEAIELANKLSVNEIISMRRNIVNLRDKFLLPEEMASSLRKAMLLES